MRLHRFYCRYLQILVFAGCSFLFVGPKAGAQTLEGDIIFTTWQQPQSPGRMIIADTRGRQICVFPSASNLALSPDGRSLAFIRPLEAGDPASRSGLFVMALFGASADPRLVSDAATSTSRPAWSPDGRQIAFIREGAGNTSRYTTRFSDIFVVNMDGSNSQRVGGAVIDISFYQVNWSPDGRSLWFWGLTRGDQQGLHRIDLETHEVQFVPDEKRASNLMWGRSPWSPDGTQRVIALTQDSGRIETFLHNEVTGETRFLTDHVPFTYPLWSRDGAYLILEEYHYQPVHVELLIVEVETNTVYPVEAAGQSSLGPVWSPDGKYILYTATSNLHSEGNGSESKLVIVDREGHIVRQFDTDGVGSKVWVDLAGSSLIENCAEAG